MTERIRLPSVDTLLNLTKENVSTPSYPLAPGKDQSQSFSSLPYPGHRRQAIALHPTGLHPDSYNQSKHELDSIHAQSYTRLPSVEEVLKGKHLHTGHMRTSPNEDSRFKSGRPVTPSTSPGKPGYPCERCGRLFTRKSDAIKHIRVVHDRLTPFSCSVCGRKFARKDYCMKHEKSIHNITPPTSPHQTRKKANKTVT